MLKLKVDVLAAALGPLAFSKRSARPRNYPNPEIILNTYLLLKIVEI